MGSSTIYTYSSSSVIKQLHNIYLYFSKIMSNVVSFFTSAYVFNWSRFFNTQTMQYPPSFDGRWVLYPSDKNLRDYLSWRQADCKLYVIFIPPTHTHTMQYPPSFDGRWVLYPSDKNLRDYLSWRQADCKLVLIIPNTPPPLQYPPSFDG